jgi:hypothetical protein
VANHLTPTELAQHTGLDRGSVIEFCVERGIPIYQGKIDKTLFVAELARTRPLEQEPSPV